jgi:hypothetical protein
MLLHVAALAAHVVFQHAARGMAAVTGELDRDAAADDVRIEMLEGRDLLANEDLQRRRGQQVAESGLHRDLRHAPVQHRRLPVP